MDRAGRRRVTAVLSLTEVTSWGVLLYAFPVLSEDIASTTGWSVVQTSAAFTLGQICAALVGIRGPGAGPSRTAMGDDRRVGALRRGADGSRQRAFVALVLAAWILAGVAMAAVLYPPAFAALTRWHGHHDRLRALTVLTVAGGLASTVFAPLTAAVAATWTGARPTGPRGVARVVTIPLHAWGLRGPWPAAPAHTIHTSAHDPGGLRRGD